MTKVDVTQRFEQLRNSRKHKLHRINGAMKIQLEDFFEETGEILFSFLIEEWMLNPGDVLHGGILATAFDISLGFHTLVLEREKTIVTTNMQVQFLKQVPLNAKLMIKSKVVRNGRTLVHLYAEAFIDDEKEVAATATASFMKLVESKTSESKMKV